VHAGDRVKYSTEADGGKIITKLEKQ
jgi:hypothetical protein